MEERRRRAPRRSGCSPGRAAPPPRSRTAGARRPSPSRSSRRRSAPRSASTTSRAPSEREVVRDASADRARAGDDDSSHASSSRCSSAVERAQRRRARPRARARRAGRARFAAAWNGNRSSARAQLAIRRRRASIAHERRPRLGKRGGERRHRAGGAALACPARCSASGADEDVEPVEQVRLERLPRRVGDLQPARFGAALAQPLEHRERHRVPAARRELVDVERQRVAGRAAAAANARAAPRRRARSTAARSPRPRPRRLGRVRGERDGVGGRLRAAVRRSTGSAGRRGTARPRACARRAESRIPSPVVPSARMPSSAARGQEVDVRPEGLLVEARPASRSGVRAAASAPRSISRTLRCTTRGRRSGSNATGDLLARHAGAARAAQRVRRRADRAS